MSTSPDNNNHSDEENENVLDPKLDDFLDTKHDISQLHEPCDADTIDENIPTKDDANEIFKTFLSLTNEEKMLFIKNLGKDNKINPSELSFNGVTDDKHTQLKNADTCRQKIRAKREKLLMKRRSKASQIYLQQKQEEKQNEQRDKLNDILAKMKQNDTSSNADTGNNKTGDNIENNKADDNTENNKVADNTENNKTDNNASA